MKADSIPVRCCLSGGPDYRRRTHMIVEYRPAKHEALRDQGVRCVKPLDGVRVVSEVRVSNSLRVFNTIDVTDLQ